MIDSRFNDWAFSATTFRTNAQYLSSSRTSQSLYIVITSHPAPHQIFDITLKDKARWLQMACADLPFIHLHISEEIALPIHDDFSDVAIDVTETQAKLTHIAHELELPDDTALFVAENHPIAQEAVKSQLSMPVLTTPLQSEFNSYAIASNPIANWAAIHPVARANYTKTVAIVGGESSGKTTLVHKLANYYGASFALEMAVTLCRD